jgi:hypothetical protein
MDSPAYYRIQLYGRLTQDWSDRLYGMDVACSATEAVAPVTTLSGWLPDQAALLGVLNGVYNIGLATLSVMRSEMAPPALDADQ